MPKEKKELFDKSVTTLSMTPVKSTLFGNLLVIGKQWKEVLLIRSSDVTLIGKQLGVLTVQVNLRNKTIASVLIDLERQLQFGDWLEIETEEERKSFVRRIESSFDQKTIEKLIVKPLISKNRKEIRTFPPLRKKGTRN